MCTFLWLPIQYTYLLLVTYTARTEVFEGYFVHILPHVWPILYKYHVFILICTLVTFVTFFYFLLLETYHIMTAHVPLVINSVHIPRLGDLFCTYGTFWWLFVYIPPPHFLSLYTIAFYGVFCIFTSSWRSFYMGGIYIRTFLCWPILYRCPLLVTYSVHWEHFCTLLFYGLFCIFTSPWWAYLYLRNIL